MLENLPIIQLGNVLVKRENLGSARSVIFFSSSAFFCSSTSRISGDVGAAVGAASPVVAAGCGSTGAAAGVLFAAGAASASGSADGCIGPPKPNPIFVDLKFQFDLVIRPILLIFHYFLNV